MFFYASDASGVFGHDVAIIRGWLSEKFSPLFMHTTQAL